MKTLSVASALLMSGVLSAGLVHAATATVTCKDGTTAAGGRGACRGHGGVDKSATAGSAKSAPAATTESTGTAATVTCKDGATSKAGRGACRGHGGVAKSGTAETVAPRAKRAVPPAPAAAVPPSAPPAAMAPPSAAPRAATPRSTPPPQVAATTHGKAASADPTGAIARCRDGVYWHSASHRGACSRHGGVESWTDQPRQ